VRRIAALVVAVAALAVAGCSGETDPATDIATDSATLKGKVSCDQGDQGQYWFSYREVGDANWTVAPHHNYGDADCPTSNHPVTEPITSGLEQHLATSTHWEFRICGTNTTVSSTPTCADSNGSITNAPVYDHFWTRHEIVGADCNTNPFHSGAYNVPADNTSPIHGTPQDDRIEAEDGPQVIYGEGGDDKILGGSGDDKLVGGPGHDSLSGESGNDLLVGDDGELDPGDAATGAGDNDCLDAGVGDDTVVGDDYAKAQSATGAPEKDILMGSSDDDVVVGDNMVASGNFAATGAASDWLAGSNGLDLVIGDDYSIGGRANGGARDSVNAGPGNDKVVGDSESDANGQTASGDGDDSGYNAIFMPWIAMLTGIPDAAAHYNGGLHMGDDDDDGWGDNRGKNGATPSGGGDDDISGGAGSDTCVLGPGTNTWDSCTPSS
jgi:Ca2+-binding RTX toxin-like protein